MKVNSQIDNSFFANNSTSLNQKVEFSNVAQNTEQGNTQNESINEQLSKLTEKLNQQAESLGTNIKFGFNDKIHSMYVSVTEKHTGRLIRQIPSEEALKLAEHLQDVIGMIFDKES
ncbi:FlaG family protein [Campylobacter sp. US33a]|uniref:FlaG family protein n=1 Tax=Campylobacter sp. CCS1377 TaxID=3158229 RepID=A0AAU7E8M1_9BACT|nr:FlaG family protein [Campylobacter sp. US33a]MCW1360541.1 FlaG family protein [Campylobacter jejuni]TEY01222.1 flagellar biosynthesis protein FlaG [Campylobacter sp. US33a]